MSTSTVAAFWTTVGCFLLSLAVMFVPPLRAAFSGSDAILLPFAAFFVAGIFLAVFAFRERGGRTRTYLLLTGLSGAGVFASIVLHNFVYGLGVALFGEAFWSSIGMGDEPVFFLLAVFVFPALFFIGAIGGAIGLIRKK